MSVVRTLSLAAAAAALSLPAMPAAADVYSFDWGFRWSIGHIFHTTDLVDSDPTIGRAVYENAILDFDLDASREFDFIGLKGTGGTIVIDAAEPAGGRDCAGQTVQCRGASITFLFGQAREGDDADYRLTAWRAWQPGAQPGFLDLSAPWSADLTGRVYSSTGGEWGAMAPDVATTFHNRVAAPVPEPALLALFALGAAGVFVGSRRRG